MPSKTFRPPVADRVARAPATGGPSREQILADRLLGSKEDAAAAPCEESSLKRINGVLVFADPVPPEDTDALIEAIRQERLREILG